MRLVDMKRFLFGGIVRNRIILNKNDALYLVFPDRADSIAYYGLLYADDYMDENNLNKCIIITSNTTIRESSAFMLCHPFEIVYLTKSEMSSFLYNLSFHVDFMGDSIYKNLFFMSSNYPYGESTKVLVEKHVFNDSYYVWNRIYNKKFFYISHEAYEHNIEYVGENEVVRRFVNKNFEKN